MNLLLTRFYQKSPLGFALTWIGIYCLTNSLAISLSESIGIRDLPALVINGILSAILLLWIIKNGLLRHLGLCKSPIAAARFLWYLPLVLFASHNLWLGISLKTSAAETICYILSMCFVGFLEEIIFRGLLFKALAKDDIKAAVIISSITFGIGHILNLFNGSGMELTANLCQVAGAIACGFLFVIIFHRGESLLPCIIAHAVNNSITIFADSSAITPQTSILLSILNIATAVIYMLILLKTLPPKSNKV